MEIHNHNLNIHYSLRDGIWDKLTEVYKEMRVWSVFIVGIPHWYAQDNDKRIINASVEPSGLQFYVEMHQEEWNTWFELFKKEASTLLGFEVGEPEDGFEFNNI